MSSNLPESTTAGTSQTETNSKPIPYDIWQAILRLEAKRIRQAEANPNFHMEEAFREDAIHDYINGL